MTSKTVKPIQKSKTPNNQRRSRKRAQTDDSDIPIQWQLFVAEYFRTGKGKQSAMTAGIAESGASGWAYKMLARPGIRIALARMRDEVVSDIKWEAKDSLRELSSIAMFDLNDFFDDLAAGKMRKVEDIPEEIRRCIKKVEFGCKLDLENGPQIYVKKVEFYDRLSAIDMLNKHKGFYEKDNEQKSNAVSDLIQFLQNKQGAGLAVKK
jgi:phage terminase small subunit